MKALAWRAVPLLSFCIACRAPAQQLQMAFIDVGQGDAVLLVTPERKTMLVDAGRNGAVVTRFLRSLGIDTLDLLIASHHHDDHIGGMPEVIAGIPVRNVMSSPATRASASRFYQRLVRASGAGYLEATSRTLTLGSVEVRVLPPPDARMPLPRAEQNNRSIGLLIGFGSFRALLTGDAQAEELEYWLQVDSVPAVTVVKVGHHGSDRGTTAAWVARTRPRAAIVSVGARNAYGHPSPASVAAWCSAGAAVYRTDQNGTIIVRADSVGQVAVSTWSPAAGIPADVVSACGGGR